MVNVGELKVYRPRYTNYTPPNMLPRYYWTLCTAGVKLTTPQKVRCASRVPGIGCRKANKQMKI
jgi:hypothetical protein